MQFALLAALFGLTTACASAPQAAVTVDTGQFGAVDFSCNDDSDCEIKDVRNCCGYFPACVNRDSETFPEQVRERCAMEGRMGVCGFPEINACSCVEKRCVSKPTAGDPE
jgi:hypothetical protein